MGNPYYGDEVQGFTRPIEEDNKATCSNVMESRGKFIALSEQRLEAENEKRNDC